MDKQSLKGKIYWLNYKVLLLYLKRVVKWSTVIFKNSIIASTIKHNRSTISNSLSRTQDYSILSKKHMIWCHKDKISSKTYKSIYWWSRVIILKKKDIDVLVNFDFFKFNISSLMLLRSLFDLFEDEESQKKSNIKIRRI